MIETVEELRKRGLVFIAGGGWLVTLSLLLMAFLPGSQAAWAALASAILNIIPTICAVRGISDRSARAATGLMAAIQPAFLLYAMQNSGWQIDMHLYFFVALASLTVLCDVRAIVIASTTIIAHHLLLVYLQPSWVFSGSSGLGRVLIHGFATVLIGMVLCWIALEIRQLLERIATARDDAELRSGVMADQSKDLQQALHRVELERTKREQLEVAKEKQRKNDLEAFSREFETSISTVVQSVGAIAKTLEQTTKQLDLIAKETGHQAEGFSSTANAAAKAADTVARGVAELTDSIAKIAVNVSQQDELTTLATARAHSGGQSVGSLAEHSDTIGEATRAIVRIAERTNLLSLNAAIEAATAGASGRGFTIVAQEVKALAMQAAEAATQIDEFLSGVRTGTIEAERSFKAIDEAVVELDEAAKAIRWDVDDQRRSADTIQSYARGAADEVSQIADKSRVLEQSAGDAKKLSNELGNAASSLTATISQLEHSTEQFVAKLKAA
ncbi:methyl-accepting chemotaxis protein [Erythrobacter sp. F6033]|uniref:methyl-accepting chemotaxis protein n=1 Tax=Erythrobacter sp. F6033 TaxID=2926401 RepID=UPI001FF1E605|nr:methyl-accepting chemotaxis protein [Erythrobacter sp. F6033]MCK0128144.1 methyl-accepting chemotaxis protein [Erythrobacter sp. F6033]